ncbi:hypothetical protein [Yoonia litorea]|uniref:Uncharacterized protein n=1 Tax=Yoonia litorea TaxID=1123755 RepID=A0A1I6L6C4_9RHOB|nr:hypothetical protein [Yoonia litorea]SFR98778.1 hypothetical protein SAMN05444714_0216 [Yoonia litorea]
MNHTNSERTLEFARVRFDHTVAQHGLQEPEHLPDDTGAQSAEAMQFPKVTSVSLDYLFLDV